MIRTLLTLVAIACTACGTDQPPTVIEKDAPKRQIIELAPPEVSLEGVTYVWTLLDAPCEETWVKEIDGEGRFRAWCSGVSLVRARAMDGNVIAAERQYRMVTGNTAPTAELARALGTTASPPLLSTSGSNDVDGDWLYYAWSVVSAPLGGEAAVFGAPDKSQTTFETEVPGRYRVAVRIEDGDGAADEAEAIVDILGEPLSPIDVQDLRLAPFVYSPQRNELALVDIVGLRIIDLDSGGVTTDPGWSSTDVYAVSPDGQRLLLSNGIILDLATGATVAGAGSSKPYALSDDTAYASTGLGVRATDIATGDTYDTDLTYMVRDQSISAPLQVLFVALSTSQYAYLDLNLPPAVTASGNGPVAWTSEMWPFADGRRLMLQDSTIVELTAGGPTVALPTGQLADDFILSFAHHADAGVFALTALNEVWLYDDETYELLWSIPMENWAYYGRLFAFEDGFALIRLEENQLYLYYIPALLE